MWYDFGDVRKDVFCDNRRVPQIGSPKNGRCALKYLGLAAAILSGATMVALIVLIATGDIAPMIIARGVFVLPFVLLWGIRTARRG